MYFRCADPKVKQPGLESFFRELPARYVFVFVFVLFMFFVLLSEHRFLPILIAPASTHLYAYMSVYLLMFLHEKILV